MKKLMTQSIFLTGLKYFQFKYNIMGFKTKKFETCVCEILRI